MSIFQQLQELLFGATKQPDAFITKPDPIALFETQTNIHSVYLQKLMGPLTGEVTPEQFSSLCYHFAKGVRYIRDRFGTEITAIVIDDKPTTSPYFNTKTNTIRIPRQFIKFLIDKKEIRQGKTEPFILSANDMATMYAVEEAYHAHQYNTNPKRFNMLFDQQQAVPDDVGYDLQPLEHEAMVVVHEAMKDMAFANTAKLANVKVKSESLGWAESTLKQRNELNQLTASIG